MVNYITQSFPFRPFSREQLGDTDDAINSPSGIPRPHPSSRAALLLPGPWKAALRFHSVNGTPPAASPKWSPMAKSFLIWLILHGPSMLSLFSTCPASAADGSPLREGAHASDFCTVCLYFHVTQCYHTSAQSKVLRYYFSIPCSMPGSSKLKLQLRI